MGLSIHYKGQIKDAASLPSLIEAVKDVSIVYGWEYRISESSFPKNTLENQECFDKIYGICFTPPGCETISLTFLSNGVMVCPSRITLFGNSENETEKNYIYLTSVKTQYAGMATHAVVINLFKYLNDNHLAEFEMIDEGLYWETGDENVLRKKFKDYTALMDNFALSLETFPVEKGEDLSSYFERLMKHIKKLDKQ